jgi:hypothetical protein
MFEYINFSLLNIDISGSYTYFQKSYIYQTKVKFGFAAFRALNGCTGRNLGNYAVH